MVNTHAMSLAMGALKISMSSCSGMVNAVMLNATIAKMIDWGSLSMSDLPWFDPVFRAVKESVPHR